MIIKTVLIDDDDAYVDENNDHDNYCNGDPDGDLNYDYADDRDYDCYHNVHNDDFDYNDNNAVENSDDKKL